MQAVLKLCIACLAGACACRPAQMALSPDLLTRAREHPVTGRQGLIGGGGFSFGPYSAGFVESFGVEKTKLGISQWTSAKSRQPYSFRLDGPHGSWQVSCLASAGKEALEVEPVLGGSLTWDLKGRTRLACRLVGPSGAGSWQMEMRRESTEPAMRGFLATRSDRVEVRGTSSLLGSPIRLGSASGYEFYYHGRLSGAVEVMNDGRVWLIPGGCCPRDDLLAAASAALLYFRDRTLDDE